MPIRLRGCPRADELAAFAAGERTSRRVPRHVSACDTCSQIVEALRRDAELVEELREAARSALDDKTMSAVLGACRAALVADDQAHASK